LLYPLIVLGLAYSLALLFVLQIAPRFVSAFDALGLPPMKSLAVLTRIGEAAPYWAPIPPALVALLALRWAWTGRSVVLDTGPLGPVLNRIPLIGSMIGYFRAANFAELLSLLIEHRVPLDEGVRLAGDASGDRVFRKDALELSESLRRGEGPDVVAPVASGVFPPLLAWMLTAGRRQCELAPALRHAAETYRRKARNRAEFLQSVMPTTLMLAIGAGAVLLYALLLFLPLTTLWEQVALPLNQ
jgi:general secretion pathway protein F